VPIRKRGSIWRSGPPRRRNSRRLAGWRTGEARPVIVRDIDIASVTSEKSEYALQLHGFRFSPIRDIRARP
jgi:hypothetical protein